MTPSAARAGARPLGLLEDRGLLDLGSRTAQADETRTADSRNGIAPAPGEEAASLWKTARQRSRPLAISWPAGAPLAATRPGSRGASGRRARRRSDRAAPLATEGEALDAAQHRQQHRRETPTWAWWAAARWRTSQPIISSETTSSFLRPSCRRSGRRPGRRAAGRRSPSQYVANDSSVPAAGRGVGEEHVREHGRGGDAVQEEVVPLDGRADEAGGDDAGDR